jgi:Mo-dependent nitrogenase C-terminus
MACLTQSGGSFDPLHPIREWLESIEIQNPKTARFICKTIPSHCPFERDIKLFDRSLIHIPPLCKLNPFFDQFVMLRFKALSYLADECHEDIAVYL